MLPQRAFVLAVALASASMTAPARAQTTGAVGAGAEDREAQRTALYREASTAAGAGHWAEARERLRAALAIRSSPKVLFSLAQTEEQLGQVASAQADYVRSIEGATAAGEGEVVQAAEQARRALSPRVPHVRVVVSVAGAARTRVSASSPSARLDGQPIGLSAAVAVDPGEHQLVVSAPGMRTATANVKVAEGQQLDVPVSLDPDSPVPPPSPSAQSAPAAAHEPLAPPSRVVHAESPPSGARGETPTSAASPWRAVGLITAGAGVVALGVGTAFGLDSMSKHNSAEKVCPGATCADANGASQWHDAVTAGNAATAAFVVGGVALVGGAILWLVAPTSSGAGTRVGFGPGRVELQGAW
jgi:hypothetical protein